MGITEIQPLIDRIENDLLLIKERIHENIYSISKAKEESVLLQKTVIERLNSDPYALLDLSVRSANCLDSADIQTVLELVSYTEKEMLSIPRFGKKQLNELKDELSKFDFHFGMFKKHEENKYGRS